MLCDSEKPTVGKRAAAHKFLYMCVTGHMCVWLAGGGEKCRVELTPRAAQRLTLADSSTDPASPHRRRHTHTHTHTHTPTSSPKSWGSPMVQCGACSGGSCPPAPSLLLLTPLFPLGGGGGGVSRACFLSCRPQFSDFKRLQFPYRT